MPAKVTGVILLEGPDGAGKTTLGKRLAELYDGLYIHRTYSPTMDIWEHHTEALQIAHQNYRDKLVIIDRLWPSELIYGRVFRDGGYYGDYNARSMDRVLLRMCAIYVMCIPMDVDYVVKVHAEKKGRGEEMFPTVKDIAVRYIDWFKGSVVRNPKGDYVEQMSVIGGFEKNRRDWYHYDVTNMGKTMERVGKDLIALIEDRKKSQYRGALNSSDGNFTGFLGTAKYMFIGEELGDPEGPIRWPFYAKTGSPDYLNKTLHSFNFDEIKAVWTNAINNDAHAVDVLVQNPELKVICMGGIAKKKCKEWGIRPHKVIHHPQWARRFNHNGDKGKPYAQEIQESLV